MSTRPTLPSCVCFSHRPVKSTEKNPKGWRSQPPRVANPDQTYPASVHRASPPLLRRRNVKPSSSRAVTVFRKARLGALRRDIRMDQKPRATASTKASRVVWIPKKVRPSNTPEARDTPTVETPNPTGWRKIKTSTSTPTKAAIATSTQGWEITGWLPIPVSWTAVTNALPGGSAHTTPPGPDQVPTLANN